MPFNLTRARKLDYKRCWDLFAKQGISVYKIPEVLMREGIFNHTTGEKFGAQAVWRGAWIYALQNLVEAKNDMAKYYLSNGQILTDDIFYKDVIAKARQFLTTKQYIEFMERNSYLKPYAE
jgi:hypothetical protein